MSEPVTLNESGVVQIVDLKIARDGVCISVLCNSYLLLLVGDLLMMSTARLQSDAVLPPDGCKDIGSYLL